MVVFAFLGYLAGPRFIVTNSGEFTETTNGKTMASASGGGEVAGFGVEVEARVETRTGVEVGTGGGAGAEAGTEVGIGVVAEAAETGVETGADGTGASSSIENGVEIETETETETETENEIEAEAEAETGIETGVGAGVAEVQPALGRLFSDVTSDHPESGYINYLARQGIVSGYANGTYGPWQPATRAQVAAILVKARVLNTPFVAESPFYDVPADYWAYSAVMGAVQAGVMTGYPDGGFGPDQTITRAEAAVLAEKLAVAPDSHSNLLELPDVPADHWAFNWIQAALEQGSLTLRWDHRFEPQAALNRGELARLLVGALYPQELEGLAPAEPAKVAYLTFDDGPSLQITPRILDITARYEVPVTFFVLGSQAARYPALVQQAAQAGHAIGNHSYSHQYAQIYSSEKSLMQEVNRANDVLAGVIGYKPVIFRAPGGSTMMRKQQAQCLHAEGYQYYDWNVSPGDASGTYKSAQSLVANTLNQAEGKDRIIVLFHDSAPKQSTADALPAVIEGLKEMGFSFAAINPLTEPIQFRKG